MNRQFPGDASHATVCAYFRIAIVVGSSHYQSAKDWAYSVIEALEAPPIEVIEVATAKDCNSAMDALKAVQALGDGALAGRWVLADLHRQLAAAERTVPEAIQAAMRIVKLANLPIEIYWVFDALGVDYDLSVEGMYGDPEAIKCKVLSALVEHSSGGA